MAMTTALPPTQSPAIQRRFRPQGLTKSASPQSLENDALVNLTPIPGPRVKHRPKKSLYFQIITRKKILTPI